MVYTQHLNRDPNGADIISLRHGLLNEPAHVYFGDRKNRFYDVYHKLDDVDEQTPIFSWIMDHDRHYPDLNIMYRTKVHSPSLQAHLFDTYFRSITARTKPRSCPPNLR